MKLKESQIGPVTILEQASALLFAANLQHSIRLMARLAQEDGEARHLTRLEHRLRRLEGRLGVSDTLTGDSN
jgi:hypothetical protein